MATTTTDRQNLEIEVEKKVLDYLDKNPDILSRHPELANRLQLSHDSGEAVSLIERQVRILREQNEQLRTQLEGLIGVAEENDQNIQRFHQLTLALIPCVELSQLRATLEVKLRDQFRADALALKLFDRENLEANKNLGQPGVALFRDFLLASEPNCGVLATEQSEFLFEESAIAINSVALVPIQSADLLGILAIGSQDEDRFHAGKATDLLHRLGEIISAVLDRMSPLAD